MSDRDRGYGDGLTSDNSESKPQHEREEWEDTLDSFFDSVWVRFLLVLLLIVAVSWCGYSLVSIDFTPDY